LEIKNDAQYMKENVEAKINSAMKMVEESKKLGVNP
jgi:hypothetical protein